MADPAAVPFGDLLRRLRARAGLTQEELAEAARLSHRSISDLERGVNRTARRETARLLAEALHLTGAERSAFEAAARGSGLDDTPRTVPLSPGTVAAATRTLPRDIASFTGREQELETVLTATTDPAASAGTVGIFAIGGMAGIGKTALAVHAAHRLATRFPDGQIFLPLHGHTPGQQPVDPADALASLLETSGMAVQEIPSGLESRTRLWRDRLAGRRILLVLDDAVAHDQVRPLLPGTAGSLVLVTSRRHLTALEDARVISLDILPPADAADLLVRLAGRPELGTGDPAVREITRLCGYLPLAVGMVARQLHHHPAWTPDEQAADLAAARDRLQLIQAENLSVAAAFDLSYQSLSARERRAFRRLGLHPGAVIDTYAAAALDGSDLDGARRNLAGLYDHYLIAEPSRGRFRMHDLIAEHARLLAATDPVADREAATDRLLEYYLRTSRLASRHLVRRSAILPEGLAETPLVATPDIQALKEASAWMGAERANLYAVTAYAASHGRSWFAVAIPAAMHGYLRYSGTWDQALSAYRRALDLARGEGDWLAEANVLTDIGDIHRLSGNFESSMRSTTRAVDICRDHAHKIGEAHALTILGYAQHDTGDNRAAGESLSSALRIYAGGGDRFGEAGTLTYMGRMQIAIGDYQGALVGLTRALEVQRALGNRLQEAGVLNFLGSAQEAAGDHAAAAANQALSLTIHQEIGNKVGEAGALRDLGVSQQAVGDYPAAVESFTRALEMHGDLGRRSMEAMDLYYLGTLHCVMREYDQAEAELAQVLKINRELGNRSGEAMVLNSMGELMSATGHPAQAQARHREALPLARATDSRPQEARALEGLGWCLIRQGEPNAAETFLQEALAIYERIGSPEARRLEDAIRRADDQDRFHEA
jgi:tetratricopeptide (TPR) repeat protein/transcriptional regulator with XRE-family HTH domain